MNSTIINPISISRSEAQLLRRPAAAAASCVKSPVMLEVPARILEIMPLPNPVTRWFVPADAAEATLERFSQLGAPGGLVSSLQQKSNQAKFENWITFFPSFNHVAALTPSVRSALYGELNKFPKNEAIAAPVVFSDQSDLRRRFAGTGIRAELVQLVEQLSYQRGEALAFSDVSLLMGQTRGEAEARSVMAALARVKTILLSIFSPSGTDSGTSAAHWTSFRGDGGQRAANLISSWGTAHQGEPLDVIHFLPPIPRMLLNTFPNLAMTLGGILPDSVWTTKNFFNAEPGPARLEEMGAGRSVTEGLSPVDGPYQFGDVLVYTSCQFQKEVHSSVYIADGIVFTKNSPKPTSPWVLQEWNDVKNLHLSHPGDRIQGYRKFVR